MKIAISAESTVDIQKELLQQYDISILPYGITLGDKSYLDGEIKAEEIYAYTAKTKVLPKTNAVNEFEFTEHFENLLKDHDAIVHVSLSSCMSSAYEHAKSAASKLNNVFVVDSRTLSTGIALLCIYGRVLANEGKTAEEIFNILEGRKQYLQVSFVLDTLEYLRKGGRCSALVAFGANLLKIHPRIIVKDGKMTNDRKYRGNIENVVNSYVKDTLKDYPNADKSIIFITYSSSDMGNIVENVRAELTANGFTNILTSTANSTVSSHCGPNTLGILYFNDGDKTTTLK